MQVIDIVIGMCISMIENLNGIYETVNYHEDFKMRIYRNKQFEDYPQHCHTDFEIIMPIENSYKVIIEEEEYLLNNEDIIIIPSNVLHQLCAPSTGYRFIIQFDSSMLDSLNNLEFKMLYPCVNVTPSSMSKVHKELSSLVLNITLEYFSTLPFKEMSLHSMLLQFFTILGRNYIHKNDKLPNTKSKKQGEHAELISNVCKYIDEHCTENIQIEDIADIAGFSKSHFARIFKQTIGISWYKYLNNRRIIYAEKLLLKSDLPIMQIAMKSGFGSLATFNRLFKVKNHCTPTEYKALYGG